MLRGKVSIVTGAATGIGYAVALKLASEGSNLVINYFSQDQEESCLELVKEIRNLGQEAITVQGDVSNYEDCKKVVEATIAKFGKVDVLVNNAGITNDKLVRKMTTEDFQRVIDINLTGTFNMTKVVYPYMIKARNGSIINMSSVIGQVGNAGQVNYSASKAGVLGVTKSVAKEVAARNVRCNAICPGFIETKMTSVLTEEQKSAILGVVPMKQYGQVEDVANAVIFLASDLSRYITGQEINVDGGMVM